MKLDEAIGALGIDYVMSAEGTDWSWYYQWGYCSEWEEMSIVDQDGKAAAFSFYDMRRVEWRIIHKNELEKLCPQKKQ